MSRKTTANLVMLLGAAIWGVAFVFQGNAMDHIGPFTIGATRFFLGAVVLVPLLFITKKNSSVPQPDVPLSHYLKAGIIVGFILFAGAALQQIGLIYTTAGKASFLSSLYMVMVPFASFVVFRRHVGRRAVFAVVLALFGVSLLCLTGDGSGINIGDVYTFLGAIFWTAQILAIEKFAEGLDGIKFAIAEFLSCAAFNAVIMFIVEKPTASALQGALGAILYCGVLSVGVGFTAQILCIKHTDPFSATLIMSTESVFGALAGWLLADESMSVR